MVFLIFIQIPSLLFFFKLEYNIHWKDWCWSSTILATWFIGKDPDAGRDQRQKEKGTTEDEMAGWHRWLNGREFEQTPGDSEGQGSLACCSPWGHRVESWHSDWKTKIIALQSCVHFCCAVRHSLHGYWPLLSFPGFKCFFFLIVFIFKTFFIYFF